MAENEEKTPTNQSIYENMLSIADDSIMKSQDKIRDMLVQFNHPKSKKIRRLDKQKT